MAARNLLCPIPQCCHCPVFIAVSTIPLSQANVLLACSPPVWVLSTVVSQWATSWYSVLISLISSACELRAPVNCHSTVFDVVTQSLFSVLGSMKSKRNTLITDVSYFPMTSCGDVISVQATLERKVITLTTSLVQCAAWYTAYLEYVCPLSSLVDTQTPSPKLCPNLLIIPIANRVGEGL